MNGNKRILTSALAVALALFSPASAAFTSSASSLSSTGSKISFNQGHGAFMGRGMRLRTAPIAKKKSNRKGELGMFLGSDGGILGVGTPEVAVIALVGYFVLGPTELFKLTKEIGKFIQNIRTLGTEASKSFESTMEDQLELQEIRKAQSELTDAFNFRRSINVETEGDAFSTIPKSSELYEESATAATAAAATAAATDGSPVKKKKRKRRRVKKKVEAPDTTFTGTGDIPDLDMSAAFKDEFKDQMGVTSDVAIPKAPSASETDAELEKRLKAERLQRLEAAQARSEKAEKEKAEKEKADQPDWFSASESDIASEVLAQQQSPEEAAAAQSRFASQLSADWNQQVMENEDKLSPLASIMDRLSILEEERKAANDRLDEEFQRRAEIEEMYYQEKRKVLEDAATDISMATYGDFSIEPEDKKDDTLVATEEKSSDKATVNGDKKA